MTLLMKVLVENELKLLKLPPPPLLLGSRVIKDNFYLKVTDLLLANSDFPLKNTLYFLSKKVMASFPKGKSEFAKKRSVTFK